MAGNGLSVLIPHGEGSVVTASCSSLPRIVYEMILVSRYEHKGGNYKKAISFIAQYTAVRNNLDIFQIAHFGKCLGLLSGDYFLWCY